MWGQFNMPIIQMIHVITIVKVTIVYLEKKNVLYLLTLPLRWPALDRLHQKTHK